jgi:heme-degrading monooxygenase HmoA
VKDYPREIRWPGIRKAALAECASDVALVSGDQAMFIAMNRFRVARGSETAFEHVWASRDSHLGKVPGFVEFHLLKGPEAEDHTLYASHTIWESKAAFEARFARRTRRPATTSRFTSTIRSSKDLRCDRR